MSAYIHIESQTYPLHEGDIRLANPDTSYPAVFSEAPEGYALVQPVARPAIDPLTHDCAEGAPGLIDGVWQQTWVLTAVGAEVQAQRAAAALQTTIAAFDAALTAHLDNTAQQRRYDNRITCMVRAGFAGPFQAEGVAFATWCDTCNTTAYAMLAAVQAGTEPMPESPAAFIATLPAMVWPD